jgi:hypothetical protein
MSRNTEHAVLNISSISQTKLTHATYLIIASANSLGLSVSVGDLSSDSVHVGGSLLGEGLAVWYGVSVLGFVVHLADELSLFELNEAVSNAFTSDDSALLFAGSVSLLSTVVLSEGVDSDLLSHVELIGNGGSSNVKPVWVIRSEILVASCFIVVGPLYNIIIY